MQLLLIIFLVGESVICCGQILQRERIESKSVPVQIAKRFDSDQTKANRVRWFKMGGLSYEVKYKVGGKQFINGYSVLHNGVERKQVIEYNELPKEIQERLQEDFFREIRLKEIHRLLDSKDANFEFYGEKGDERIMFRL